MTKVIPFAPGVRGAAFPSAVSGETPVATAGDEGGAPPSRPAQSNSLAAERAAAVRDTINHACRIANQVANGDAAQRRELMLRQGEVMLLAGLQMMLKADEA